VGAFVCVLDAETGELNSQETVFQNGRTKHAEFPDAQCSLLSNQDPAAENPARSGCLSLSINQLMNWSENSWRDWAVENALDQ
jgi:hypothetical protein